MKIRDLCKEYDVAGRKIRVLDHLNLDADDHGITVVLGRSGCGKTTLLRLAAGLEKADKGTVETGSQGEKGDSPGGMFKTGVIFQEPRLMPWLTIGDNILFGAVKSRDGKNRALNRLLELTGLQGFENAYPSQLSGGMQQRAALARALAYEPDYLLMDEPFAALDYFTRRQMQKELLRIHQAEKKGILFVTHSIDEALTIGKKVVILADGGCKTEYKLEDIPYPRDLFSGELVNMKRDVISRLEGDWGE